MEVPDEGISEVQDEPDGGSDAEEFEPEPEENADGAGALEGGEGGEVEFGDPDGAADDGADLFVLCCRGRILS